jgi:pimeloyl-ACP methyl ester carboxylesterase
MAHLELSTGNTLSYELIEPSDTGFTFVFFNALSGDKSMWTSTVGDKLTAAGHGMLLYNLRGQAGSETTAAEIDCASIIQDAKALLDHVQPPRPIHVGLSIGGLFALEAHLAGRAGRADAIVLINTLRKPGPRLDWVNDAVVRAAEVGGFDLMKDLLSPLLMNTDWQAQNRADFLNSADYTPCKPDDRALMLLKSGATADWDVAYENVDVPVLAITGLQDRVFLDRDDVRALAQRMPHCQCLDLANAGHMVPVERPDELGNALIDFAASLRPS